MEESFEEKYHNLIKTILWNELEIPDKDTNIYFNIINVAAKHKIPVEDVMISLDLLINQMRASDLKENVNEN